MKITQKGPIKKIGIVFEPFGVNQFLGKPIEMNKVLSSPLFNFFENQIVHQLFNSHHIDNISAILEEELIKMFNPNKNYHIEQAIYLFHNSENKFSVNEMAEFKLGINRKQLN